MPTHDRLHDTRKWLILIAASIVLMTLSACATAPAPNAVLVQPTGPAEVRATHAETDGPAVWVKGRYAYVRGAYEWVPGHWVY